MRIIGEITEENGVPMRCVAIASYEGIGALDLQGMQGELNADLTLIAEDRKRIYFMRKVL